MDADRLVRGLARLSRASAGDFEVDSMLRELSAVAAEVFDVDGAGVMAGEGRRARYVQACGGPRMVAVEQVQEVLGEGPCLDCLSSGEPVVVADLREDPRWPRYAPSALELNVRAVAAVPLVGRGRTWGSVDLYRTTPGPWTAEVLDGARLLADVATSYIVLAVDRDTARAAQQQLAWRAMTDPLTGLPNRALLVDRMTHALAVGHRSGRVNAAVFIDLDRFKDINDGAGHAVGDAVLIEVARRLTSVLRQGDTVARLGGDEFVLFCENLPGTDEEDLTNSVAGITGRLRDVLALPLIVDGTEMTVSASIGVALTRVALTGAALTADDLLAIADTAMYEAKERGRDRVVVSGPLTGGRPAGGTRQLQRDLVGALDRSELSVYYQPIVEAAGRRLRAVEALVRWNHPVHGLLTAETFIPLAAGNGTLPRIGRWVIEQACAQLRDWQRQPDVHAPEVMFCNLSPRELTEADLADAVADTLTRHQLTPGHLGLEILEASLADGLLVPLLDRYRQSGHPLAIDDFGTGYSSLSRLVHLSVDYAKIDRSFVAGLPDDTRSQALVDAVLTVAATLGLRVIAEGVETQAQADYLTAAGCDLLQGFHLARPLPAAAVTALLTTAL